MGGKDSKQQEPTPPEPSSVPKPAPEPVKAVSPPVKETAKPTMSEPTAPPEAKEYPEFPGEKLSKRYAPCTPSFSSAPRGARVPVLRTRDGGRRRSGLERGRARARSARPSIDEANGVDARRDTSTLAPRNRSDRVSRSRRRRPSRFANRSRTDKAKALLFFFRHPLDLTRLAPPSPTDFRRSHHASAMTSQ